MFLQYDGHTVPLLWNLATDQGLGELSGYPAGAFGEAAFSPDGRVIATAAPGDGFVRLWDLASRKEFCSVQRASPWGTPQLLLNEKFLVTVDAKETIVIWEPHNGKQLLERRRMDTEHNSSFVAFAPDGRVLAAKVDSLGTILVDVETLEECCSLPDTFLRWSSDATFSPDGKSIATRGAADSIYLWDWPTGQQKAIYRTKGGLDYPRFSPDGQMLIVRSYQTDPLARNLPSWMYDRIPRRFAMPDCGLQLLDLASGHLGCILPRATLRRLSCEPEPVSGHQ